MFERDFYSVSTNSGVKFNPHIVNKFEPIIFKLMDGSLSAIPNYNLYYNFQIVSLAVYGLNSSLIWLDWFVPEPCNINSSFGEYKQYFEQIQNIDTYYCVKDYNKMNQNLQGTYGNTITGYSTFDLLLNLCSNATTNNSCGALEKQQQYLKSVFLSYGYIDYTIYHNNSDTPISPALILELLPLSATLFTRYFYSRRTVDYETDYGIIFSNKEQITFYQIDSKSTYVDLSVNLGGDTAVKLDGVKFGQISNNMNQVNLKYNRSYQRLQEMIASIGGILSIITFAGYIVVNFYGRRVYLLDLANIYFRFDNTKLIGKRVQDTSIDISKKGSLVNLSNSDEMKPLQINCIENKNSSLKVQEEEEKQNQTQGQFAQKEYQIPIPLQSHKNLDLNFEGRVDENGKLKVNLKNIIFPNRAIKLVIRMIEKKMSIDEILRHFSQIEKIKKCLFDQKSIDKFNNLPNNEFIEELFQTQDKSFNDQYESLLKEAHKNIESRFAK